MLRNRYIYQAWKCGRTTNRLLRQGLWQLCGYTDIKAHRKKEYLCKSVNIIQFLAKLGLPFCGHRENADESMGNYLSICRFFFLVHEEISKKVHEIVYLLLLLIKQSR